MAVFDFRPGHSIKGIDPQDLGEWLERLREQRGTLTAAIVLEAASDEDSVGHGAFEWDDSKAAKAHRLTQARKLIVSVRILDGPKQPPNLPVYVSVKTPTRGREFVPTVKALSEEQIRARVLDEIRQFIESMERRWGYFKEAADLLDRLGENNVG